MSVVSSRASLTSICRIERDLNAGDASSGWGQPASPNWQTHLDNLPCRYWQDTGREVVDGQVIEADDIRLIVAPGNDVTAADRIAWVTDRGVTVLNGPLAIRGVIVTRDHIELVLARYS